MVNVQIQKSDVYTRTHVHTHTQHISDQTRQRLEKCVFRVDLKVVIVEIGGSEFQTEGPK